MVDNRPDVVNNKYKCMMKRMKKAYIDEIIACIDSYYKEEQYVYTTTEVQNFMQEVQEPLDKLMRISEIDSCMYRVQSQGYNL